jgi:hypothetical protein
VRERAVGDLQADGVLACVGVGVSGIVDIPIT